MSAALLICDVQNDFLHAAGAYARAGLGTVEMAALPGRLAAVAAAMRAAGGRVIATEFTLVPDGDGVLIAPSWGQRTVDELQPADFAVEKIAYSAFYMTRLEWLLRRLGISRLVVGGIVTNGGVASTVRDAAVREFQVTLLEDGCAAFDRAAHETAIASLRGVCEVARIETVLKQI